jgi:cold-inducible RNA-binding protein
MAKRLYVGNIPFQTTEAELRTLFEADGAQVSEVKIVLDRESGRSRGFAFVEMSTDAQALAAIEALHGRQFGGRALNVSEAHERQSR